MASFQSVKQAAQAIEGMLSDFSIAVMDAMLSFQEHQGVVGHIVEFGVFKGRSAAVLAGHAKPNERLILVDVHDYNIERERIRKLCPHVEILLCSSDEFSSAVSDYTAIKGACRYIHIDSSHQYQSTFRELKLSEALVRDKGMIVLDDFTNLDYSQILAATYKYLYTANSALSVFLVTSEKAYLCKKHDFELFGKFVLERIVDEMAARDTPNVCIARTDSDPEYKAFNLRFRFPGETGVYCGEHIFGRFYQQP